MDYGIGRLIFSCFLCLTLHQGTSGSSAKVDEPVMAAYCDIVNDPIKFDGKPIIVWATYRYGFEVQELFCLECRDQGKAWLEFSDALDKKSRNALKKLPKREGTINAVFRGTFEASGGPYGHLEYRFKFVVTEVRQPEVVSKSGWAPEYLPSTAQQKLCGSRAARKQHSADRPTGCEPRALQFSLHL